MRGLLTSPRLSIERLLLSRTWGVSVEQQGIIGRQATKRLLTSTSEAVSSKDAPKINAFSAVLLVPSIVCGYLSYWQYQRGCWKGGLIQEREEGLESPALDIYEMEELKDYAKVAVSGRLIHERSIFVGPRPRSVPGFGIRSGYFVITPLYDPVRKGAVLVNRGWVPASWLNDIDKVSQAHDTIPQQQIDDPSPSPSPSSPPIVSTTPAKLPAPSTSRSWFGWLSGSGRKSTEAGAVEEKDVVQKKDQKAESTVRIVGVIQPSETPSAVIPDNIPERLRFSWVEVPALAEAVGLPHDTPLVQALTEDPAANQQADRHMTPVEKARHASMGLLSGEPSYPLPKNTYDLVQFTTMPKDHWIYSGIWGSLCLALGVMARHAIITPPKTLKMIGGFDNKKIWSRMQKEGS